MSRSTFTARSALLSSSTRCSGASLLRRRIHVRAGMLLSALLLAGCCGIDDPWQNTTEHLCRLEADLRDNGLVTIKRPDVWTENRLYPYRREFEDVFFNTQALKDFKPTLTASESAVQTRRLGMYLDAALEIERIRADKGPGLSQFLSLALLQNLEPGKPLKDGAFMSLLQAATKAYVAGQTGLDPTMFAGLLADEEETDEGRTPPRPSDTGKSNTPSKTAAEASTDESATDETSAEDASSDDADTGDTGGEEPPAGDTPSDDADGGKEEPASPYAFTWLLDGVEDLHKVPDAAGTLNLLSPYEIQKQKRAFVQQNHMFRIGNEPDDGTRMNGYRLYYMRFMVSVTPSRKTQRGHSAEIMLTPTYSVREAARDWVAQYMRGLLRERILHVVEVGLERTIAAQLYAYGNRTMTWRRMWEAKYLLELLEGWFTRLHELIKKEQCDEATALSKQLVEVLDQLNTYGYGGAHQLAVASLRERLQTYEASCREIATARSKVAEIRESCARQVQTTADLLSEIDPVVTKQILSPFTAGRFEEAVNRSEHIAEHLRTVASFADPNNVLESISTAVGIDREEFHSSAAQVLDRPENMGTYDREDIAHLASLVNQKQALFNILDRFNQEASKAQRLKQEELRAQQTEEKERADSLTKWQAIKVIKERLEFVLGAQQDEDAAAYAHDVATKLRNEYMGVMRLAQIAYDELSREIDDNLGIPSAVQSGEDTPGRVDRAITALCDILASGSEDSLLKLSRLAPQVNPAWLARIDYLRDAAVDTLAERINAYASPVDTQMLLYNLPQSQQITSKEDRISLSRLTGVDSWAYDEEYARVLKIVEDRCPKCRVDPQPCPNLVRELDVKKLREFFSTDNWPIYTFAVAPFSEAENIGRAIDLNNEVQLRMNAAVRYGQLGDINAALEYARAVREQLRAVEVNRTVVGIVRGEQNFGWQINPPYTLPVKVQGSGSRYERTKTSARMPSQTHEVFALVAVPGFLRSMDFGVHYDWTGVQRTDSEVIGTNKAAKYLRCFREIDNALSQGKPAKGDGDDPMNLENAFFLGELYRQRLELVESSLPLRMMRRVFLPYADVSERMTNTAGVSNLLPKITRIIPRYLPSEQSVVVTIEGKNFDTGRIEVMIGGYAATNVKVLNEQIIVATVPARGIIADLTVTKRDGKLFNDARDSKTGKMLLHDVEGIVDVVVVTPAGLANDVALVRITKPVEDEKTDAIVPGTLPEKAVIVASSLWNQTDLNITLAMGLKETSGTLVLKHENETVDLPVTIKDKNVVIRDGIGGSAYSTLLSLVGKEISNVTLYPHGGMPTGITIKGKIKVEKLEPKAPEKLKLESGTTPIVKEKTFELNFGRAVNIKAGKLVLANKANKDQKQSIDLTDLSGSKIAVPMTEDHRKTIATWLGKATKIDIVVTVDVLQRGANTMRESYDCGETQLAN